MRTLEGVSAGAAGDMRVVPLRLANTHLSTTIALVEVEPMLADSVKYTIERDGYRIVVPATRQATFAAMQVETPALVLAEVGALSSDALDFCRNLRASSSASIILITQSLSEAERADALQAGANDVMIKPFSVRDLAHRVSHHLNREHSFLQSPDPDTEILRVGPVEMDVTNHEVRVRGKLTVFPPKEFALLETLLRSRGRLLTRARLIVAVWGPEYYGDGKTLDTHVKRLREKIEADRKRPTNLIVVRGLGYRFLDQTLAE